MSNLTIKATPTFDKVGGMFKQIADGMRLQEEVTRFGFAVERESKKNAPVDTGRMRASIGTDIGNLQARIGPNVNYATYVHEGTWKMKGRPFMSSGLATARMDLYGNKAPFYAYIETAFNNGIRKI